MVTICDVSSGATACSAVPPTAAPAANGSVFVFISATSLSAGRTYSINVSLAAVDGSWTSYAALRVVVQTPPRIFQIVGGNR